MILPLATFEEGSLSELVSIEIGRTPSRSNPTFWDGSQKWLTISDFDHGDVIDDTKERITQKAVTDCGIKIHGPGTLVMSFKLTIGKLGILGQPMATNEAIVALTPLDKRVIDVKYLYHFLSQYNFDNLLDRAAKGRTLNKAKLRRVSVRFPSSLEAQRRIAAILDKADNVWRKRRTALSLADGFLKSVFFEMFGDLELDSRGWDTSLVSDVLETDPQNGLYKPSRDYGSGTPILRIDSFYDGYLVSEKPLKRLRIDEKTAAKYRLMNGDIVINRVNSREYLGKSALIEGLEEETVFESNMMRFRADDAKVNSRFLVDQLQTQYIRRQISRASKDAVNQSSINQTDVNNFEIRVPPLKLQQVYADTVAIKKRNDLNLDLARVEANHLFSSLSQLAFRGEC